jgi:DNA repair protein RecN (Recombination protein N)
MISFLKIENLAIIDSLSLELGPGLNVLTGETGAGKSIIADALGLILGGRASAELVRTGCQRLSVEALFEGPWRGRPAGMPSAMGIDAGDEGLIVRREVTSAGRSRAFVNGTLVTLPQLREIAMLLAELHGQHEHQSLLRAEGQREALDRFAEASAEAEAVSNAATRLRALIAERDTLRESERSDARRADNLRSEIVEIEAISPEPGEEEELQRVEGLLRNAEEVSLLASEICQILNEDDASVLTALGPVRDRLERLAGIDDRCGAALKALDEAVVGIEDALHAIEPYRERDDDDPGRLEETAARLAALQKLRRKYGPGLEEVVAYLAGAKADLEEIGSATERLEAIDTEVAAAARGYAQAAGRLSARRRAGAKALSARIGKELKALAMDGCRVEVVFEEHSDPESPARLAGKGIAVRSSGMESIEFLVAPNAGEDLRPLSKIASGGELSRLMLALHTVSQEKSDRRALVFDEVDSGVGGTVAESVGKRLKALAAGPQVICVTHLPQIAALADVHVRVSKSESGGRTVTSAARLEGKERVDELARMLGAPQAPTARRHAAALISGARES